MLNAEFVKLSNNYQEAFDAYYREWFKGFNSSDLVKHERILSTLVDNAVVYDSLVIDEVVKMLEFIRDECVRRVAMSCERV